MALIFLLPSSVNFDIRISHRLLKQTFFFNFRSPFIDSFCLHHICQRTEDRGQFKTRRRLPELWPLLILAGKHGTLSKSLPASPAQSCSQPNNQLDILALGCCSPQNCSGIKDSFYRKGKPI